MVSAVGIEPTTFGLEGQSTIGTITPDYYIHILFIFIKKSKFFSFFDEKRSEKPIHLFLQKS